ncbi:MAG: AmmeMemoRadiSam system protein A, partial [Pseudomonadales bacterium]
ASNASAYRSPLGNIPIDGDAIAKVLTLPATGYLDEAHTHEHSLEVHLPFLQLMLADFSLVPLVVGDANKEDVARVLEILWGGDETLIVISSDLSHYHPYEEANRIDTSTSAKILALDSTLKGEEACGCRPINGLLYLAEKKGLQIEQVDVRNSGDTAGTHDQVVGYGAYVIGASGNGTGLSLAHRQALLQVARESILQSLKEPGNFNVHLADFPPPLVQERASFVTLNRHGRLRGCIGSLAAHRPLVVDVASNARAAAFKDPRFKPLTADEFYSIDLHLSVLTPPSPIDVQSRDELIDVLRPGIDGLIIEEDGRRSTYLPSVWEQLPDPARFVAELRRKAGLAADEWRPSTRVFRNQTEEFY